MTGTMTSQLNELAATVEYLHMQVLALQEVLRACGRRFPLDEELGVSFSGGELIGLPAVGVISRVVGHLPPGLPTPGCCMPLPPLRFNPAGCTGFTLRQGIDVADRTEEMVRRLMEAIGGPPLPTPIDDSDNA
jgi:hypothetical protein